MLCTSEGPEAKVGLEVGAGVFMVQVQVEVETKVVLGISRWFFLCFVCSAPFCQTDTQVLFHDAIHSLTHSLTQTHTHH